MQLKITFKEHRLKAKHFYMCTCKPLFLALRFNSTCSLLPRGRETASVLFCNGDRREWTGKGKQRGKDEAEDSGNMN